MKNFSLPLCAMWLAIGVIGFKDPVVGVAGVLFGLMVMLIVAMTN